MHNLQEDSCHLLMNKQYSFNVDQAMEIEQSFNIYECFDQSGDPSKYICDGHVDSVSFREKCFSDFFIKPLVIQHQWQRTRKFVEREPDKKFSRCYIRSVPCNEKDKDATPVTVGLV